MRDDFDGFVERASLPVFYIPIFYIYDAGTPDCTTIIFP